MERLTKKVRQKILEQNDGFIHRTSYDSKNHRYDREYRVSDGKLYIRESGKTSWSDSRYDESWEASDEEIHRFLYENQWRMNTDNID